MKSIANVMSLLSRVSMCALAEVENIANCISPHSTSDYVVADIVSRNCVSAIFLESVAPSIKL